MEDITAIELKTRMDNGTAPFIIDVREPWEYEEFNLGGQLIPVGDIMNKMWELEDHKESEIMVHCRSGADC